MPNDGKIYTILVSCPSDIEEEISIVKEEIIKWNERTGYNKNTFLRFVQWKNNTIPEYGDRPQALINDQIVINADIIIGIFWTRFGSKTGKADSGTVEEIKLCIEQEKDIMLYFSNLPIPKDKINSEELLKIEGFKKEYSEDGIYWNYNNLNEFRDIFSYHLNQLMEKILKRVPDAIYWEIINNLEMIIKIYEQFKLFLETEKSQRNNSLLRKQVDVLISREHKLSKDYYISKSFFIPENSYEKSVFVPMENRDAIKTIYDKLDFVIDYIRNYEKYEMKNILEEIKLSSIEVLSWFLLTKPRKKIINKLINIYKDFSAFNREEFNKISFTIGKIGWKQAREFYSELYSQKIDRVEQEVISLNNKETRKEESMNNFSQYIKSIEGMIDELNKDDRIDDMWNNKLEEDPNNIMLYKEAIKSKLNRMKQQGQQIPKEILDLFEK